MPKRGRPPKDPESEPHPLPRPVVPDEDQLSRLLRERLERAGADADAGRPTPPEVWAEMAVLARRLRDEPGARHFLYEMRLAKVRQTLRPWRPRDAPHWSPAPPDPKDLTSHR